MLFSKSEGCEFKPNRDNLFKGFGNLYKFILFFKSPLCHSSYSSNRPSAKELTQHGIITSLSPQQQPRPFPSLLYKSFFYGLNTADKFSRVFS